MYTKNMKPCLFVIILVTFLFCSCSSVPELKLLYQLPSNSSVLKGKSIVLEIEDQRKDKSILTERAKEKFKGFTGNLSFSLARHGEEGFKIGVFDTREVLVKSFKKRLEVTGLKVFLEHKQGIPVLKIYINELHLDQVDRKWIARMSYDAKLEVDGKVVSTQSLSGSAERYRTVGKRGADTVFAELYTDMLNRLDVVKLFKDAKLIQ